METLKKENVKNKVLLLFLCCTHTSETRNGRSTHSDSPPPPWPPPPMDECEKVRKVTLLNPDLMPTLRRLIEWEHK